jgi:hypothetical protein
MSQSKFYHISPSGKLTGVGSVTEALTSVNDGGFLWLDQGTRKWLWGDKGKETQHPALILEQQQSGEEEHT